MSTDIGLKDLHDQMLAEKPEGAEHDADGCPFCGSEAVSNHDSGGSMPETFTQEDIDAATAAAVGPLQRRLAELEAQVQESEVGRAVTDVTKAKDTEISELQTQLDAVTAARTAAESKLSETEKFWTETIAAQEAAAELATRRQERIAAATEAGVFDEKYIAENADRFAAMADDDFQARLGEWRLIAAAKGPEVRKPAQSALVASQQDVTPPPSQLGALTDFRRLRVDPRTLVGGM